MEPACPCRPAKTDASSRAQAPRTLGRGLRLGSAPLEPANGARLARDRGLPPFSYGAGSRLLEFVPHPEEHPLASEVCVAAATTIPLPMSRPHGRVLRVLRSAPMGLFQLVELKEPHSIGEVLGVHGVTVPWVLALSREFPRTLLRTAVSSRFRHHHGDRLGPGRPRARTSQAAKWTGSGRWPFRRRKVLLVRLVVVGPARFELATS